MAHEFKKRSRWLHCRGPCTPAGFVLYHAGRAVCLTEGFRPVVRRLPICVLLLGYPAQGDVDSLSETDNQASIQAYRYNIILLAYIISIIYYNNDRSKT